MDAGTASEKGTFDWAWASSVEDKALTFVASYGAWVCAFV